MTVFHANLMIEPPKGSDQAAYAQAVYDEVIQLFIQKGCGAVGAFHAAPDKGCDCNVLAPKTVQAAVERGVQILQERGQLPPQTKG